MISNKFGYALFNEPTWRELVTAAVLVGGGYAVIVGTILFLLGIVLRLTVDWIAPEKCEQPQ